MRRYARRKTLRLCRSTSRRNPSLSPAFALARAAASVSSICPLDYGKQTRLGEDRSKWGGQSWRPILAADPLSSGSSRLKDACGLESPPHRTLEAVCGALKLGQEAAMFSMQPIGYV